MRRTFVVGNAPIALAALVLFATATHVAARSLSLPAPGKPLGRLQIPSVGLNVVLFEGVSDATLRKGPGHIPETAWPALDRTGYRNCAIAGHRDSFFRPLRNARAGDVVHLVDVSGNSRTYRLQSKQIVGPEDLSVIAPTGHERLTLITCYPFHWKGAAPYRLVWIAVPVEPASAKTRGRHSR